MPKPFFKPRLSARIDDHSIEWYTLGNEIVLDIKLCGYRCTEYYNNHVRFRGHYLHELLNFLNEIPKIYETQLPTQTAPLKY